MIISEVPKRFNETHPNRPFTKLQNQQRPMSHTSSFDSSIAEPDEDVDEFGMGSSGFNQNRISPARYAAQKILILYISNHRGLATG